MSPTATNVYLHVTCIIRFNLLRSYLLLQLLIEFTNAFYLQNGLQFTNAFTLESHNPGKEPYTHFTDDESAVESR